jgi:hypothetical protein
MPEFRDLAKLQESQFMAWEERQKIIDRVLLANYRAAYKETMAQIASLYAKVGLDDPVKGVYIRKEDAIRYNQLGNRLANLEDELKALGKKGVRLTEDNSAQSIQDGYYRNAWAYTQTVGMELGIPALPIDAIREAVYPSLRFGPNKETGLNLVSTWNKNSTDMLYKTQSALMRGITMGQSYTKMAGSIKTEFDKGLWQAMRVVRTEAGRCWSEGAEKSHEAAIEAGLDVKKRWSAALDKRTRIEHARLDGTYADKDGLFWIGGEGQPQPRLFSDPAQSINCRCAVYDVLEGLEPTMRRIRDLEGDDGYSSEKAKSRIVPYQSFETWAKPQGWTADKGWPRITTTAAQADKAVKATSTAKTVAVKPWGGEYKAKLAYVESTIRPMKVEHGVVISGNGEVVSQKIGSKKKISYTQEELSKWSGNTFTHNHPASNHSFSWQDISTGSGAGVVEMRAISTNYDHSMKPGPDGWGPGWWESKGKRVFKRMEKLTTVELFEKDRAKEFKSETERGVWFYHELWNRFADKTGVVYTRTEATK